MWKYKKTLVKYSLKITNKAFFYKKTSSAGNEGIFHLLLKQTSLTACHAVGGFIKRQADLAILRARAVIQNAKVFYKFANSSLQETKSDKCQRRTFKYCDQINRASDWYYKPIQGIKSSHQVIVHDDEAAILHTRILSCYDCDRYVTGRTEMWNHRAYSIDNFW